ncbi:MAG: NAD(P)-binding domain-containing protein [Hyphomicrobiaceae bacterium]
MKYATTIIIGAGQAGLAMSKHLADRSVDHVLLERGHVANSWATERWDSLRLLTPNWQSRLPGFRYAGDDPDGFMDMPEVTKYLTTYAAHISAPVQTDTTVTSVRSAEGGYIVSTNRETWACAKIVLANGACNVAQRPKIADDFPSTITQLTPLDYKSTNQLPDGGVLVVGASATGVQLAREIQASGRNVTLAVGEHIRVPRRFRGRDIKWWMEVTGLLDIGLKDVDDIARARKLPSLQLAGSPDNAMLDLNALAARDVEVVGRLAGLHNGRVQFSGSLANTCSLADLKMNRLLVGIDQWVEEKGSSNHYAPSHRFAPTNISTTPRLDMNLTDGSVKTVIWATGFRPDYSWLHVPVLDRKGRIRHDGGVVAAPGMYVLGLPFLRKRKSTLIDGVGADAEHLANHLSASLEQKAA